MKKRVFFSIEATIKELFSMEARKKARRKELFSMEAQRKALSMARRRVLLMARSGGHNPTRGSKMVEGRKALEAWAWLSGVNRTDVLDLQGPQRPWPSTGPGQVASPSGPGGGMVKGSNETPWSQGGRIANYDEQSWI